MLPDPLSACVIRVCNTKGETLGTGFVVSDVLALTCAHVVRACDAAPGDRVCVVFYANGEACEAEVLPEFWRAPEADDVAVLRLLPQDATLLAGVVPAKLGATRACNGHAMRTMGFPELPGGYDVAWAEGELRGVVPHSGKQPMLQMDAHPILRGMSGAPMLDLVTQRVIGVVNEFITDAPLEWATTSETLAAICRGLKLHPPQAVEDYLDAVHKFCADLPFVSLRKSMPLEKIYVRQLVRELPPSDETTPVAIDGQPPITVAQPSHAAQSVSINEALQQHKRFIVIGGPGSGKSTLLRYLAEQSERSYLPILVSWRGLAEQRGDLATCLRKQIEEELGKYLAQTLPENFLVDWANQANATWIIALDGLDEIANAGRRLQLILELTQWAWPPSASIIITTRPEERPLPLEGFPHFEILPLDPHQVEDFGHAWFEENKPQSDSFLAALKTTHLGETSSTPLLLTVAATVFDRSGSLPYRRSQLYESFVAILLGEDGQTEAIRTVHKSFRERFGTGLGEKLFVRRREILERIAWAIQGQRDVQQTVADYLQQHLQCDQVDAIAEATSALEILAAQRNGLLAQRGSWYEFIHPTFREYLAAMALLREHGPDVNQLWQSMRPQPDSSIWDRRWIYSHWHEVIRFLLAKLSDDGQDYVVNEFIERIGIYTKETLLFAGTALAENTILAPDRARQIREDLLALVRDSSDFEEQAIELLVELGETERLISVWVSILEKNKGYRFDERVLDLLVEWNKPQTLLELATDEQVNEDLRATISYRLRKMNLSSEAAHAFLATARSMTKKDWNRARWIISELRDLRAVSELFVVLRDENIWDLTRVEAAKALQELGELKGTNEIKGILANIASGIAADWDVTYREATGILLDLMNDQEILDAIQDKTAGALLRSFAIERLIDQNHFEELLVIARNAMIDWPIRIHVADRLLWHGYSSRLDKSKTAARRWALALFRVLGSTLETIPTLTSLLCSNQVHGFTRSMIAHQMFALGFKANAIQILLNLAHDNTVEISFRELAPYYLGEEGLHTEATQAWIALISDNNEAPWKYQRHTIGWAVESASKLGTGVELGLALLAKAKDRNANVKLRLSIIHHLIVLGYTADIVPLLMEISRDAEVDEFDLKLIARNLAEHGYTDEAAQIWASVTLKDSLDSADMDEINALNRPEQFAQALVAIVQDQTLHYRAHEYAIWALEKIGRTEEFIQGWLWLAQDSGTDDSTRWEFFEKLQKMGRVAEMRQAWLALAQDGYYKAPHVAQFLGWGDEGIRLLKETILDENTSARKRCGSISILFQLRYLGNEQERAGFSRILLTIANDRKLDVQLRLQAIDLLDKLGCWLEPIPSLREIANDDQFDAQDRYDAIEQLEKLGRVDEAMDMFISLAHDKKTSDHICDRITYHLQEYPYANASVLPKLESIVRRGWEENLFLRWAACGAVKRIRGLNSAVSQESELG